MNIKYRIRGAFGSRTNLAKSLGVSVQAVRKWEMGRFPAERCPEIEKLSGGQILRSDLRPDLFDPPTSRAA